MVFWLLNSNRKTFICPILILFACFHSILSVSSLYSLLLFYFSGFFQFQFHCFSDRKFLNLGCNVEKRAKSWAQGKKSNRAAYYWKCCFCLFFPTLSQPIKSIQTEKTERGRGRMNRTLSASWSYGDGKYVVWLAMLLLFVVWYVCKMRFLCCSAG